LSSVLESTGDLRGAAHHLWRAQDLAPGRPGDSQRLISLYQRLLEKEQAAR
jgi:hypothetical protein